MRRLGQVNHAVPLAAALAFAALIAPLASLLAQQAGTGAPPKPWVPVAANIVATNPDAYYGQSVTMTAAVDQILSKTAFSIGQRTVGEAAKRSGSEAAGVLVVAPSLHDAVDLNAYVTVLGEVVRFDPAAITSKVKDYKADLAPDVLEKYRGRPAVLATSVINAKMVDLAKRPPPPVTAEEEALDKIMKRVGPAFAALRSGLDESSADNAKQNATALKQALTETEAFWKAKGKTDAIQWAQDARKQVESIESQAAGGDWDTAKTSAGTLNQACQSCHAAYRERLDDGTFRIKAGPGTSGR